MKINIILEMSMMLLSFSAFAVKPPLSVKTAFNQKFPNVPKVNWGKEDSTEYEAEFLMNGIEMSVNFSSDGTWLETETEIPLEKLPANVLEAVKKQVKPNAIKEASKIESDKKGILFEVEVKIGLKTRELFFKEDGTEVK